MDRTEKDVKQEVTWRREAEEDYERSRPWHAKAYRGLRRLNVLAIAVGALLGLLIGEGWNRMTAAHRNMAQRTVVLYEAYYRLSELTKLLSALQLKTVGVEALKSQYSPYVTNSLAPSPFACFGEFKDTSDAMLGVLFERAGGDSETAEQMGQTFGDVWDVLNRHTTPAQPGEVFTDADLTALRNKASSEILGLMEHLEKHADMEPLYEPFRNGKRNSAAERVP